MLRMVDLSIKQVDPSDDEILEEWVRGVEDGVLGVDCTRSDHGDWPWQVAVCVMEFLPAGSLRSQLVSAITASLRGVPGVRDAQQEDCEVWAIAGDPSGRELVQAVAAVIDQFASRARALLDARDADAELAPRRRPWWRFW